MRTLIKHVLAATEPKAATTVKGWVRTRRDSKGFSFLELNDGSCFGSLQVIVDAGTPGYEHIASLTTGASTVVEGKLVPSPAQGQKWELRATKVELVGAADASYPLQKKGHTMEFLRTIAHLRPRSNLFGAMFRTRSRLALAVHEFFQRRDFFYIQTPIITASDCEGAGEMFRVTTLPLTRPSGTFSRAGEEGRGENSPKAPRIEPPNPGAPPHPSLSPAPSGGEGGLWPGEGDVRGEFRPPTMDAHRGHEPQDAQAVDSQASHPAVHGRGAAADFFGKPTFLTVSGQLEAETFACALSNVYTFGPTFRAENSNTARHAAEFWMIEPEMAFCDLNGDMDLAEEFIKAMARYALEHCAEDLAFFARFVDKGVNERLQFVVERPFVRVPYTEAIEILKKSGKQFDFPVDYGQNLQSEHERFLTEEHFKSPTTVFNYPRGIKPFYMRLNDDRKTVTAMDVLVPGIGEVIGGAQREERLDQLQENMKFHQLRPEDYWWYTDLRRYGTVPHAGFGLGFERLLMFLTGVSNIRDVIPFARTPGNAEF